MFYGIWFQDVGFGELAREQGEPDEGEMGEPDGELSLPLLGEPAGGGDWTQYPKLKSKNPYKRS